MEHEGSLPCSQGTAIGLTLSHLNPVHTVNLTSLRTILILFFHLFLGFPSGLFPTGFPTEILYAFLIYPMPATCPTHYILLNFITLMFGEA